MQLDEMTIEQARAAEARAYIVHAAALTDAVHAYRSGLDLAPWAEQVERTRESWHLAQDALDIVIFLNGGMPERRRP
jgi:hypothetical protein